MRSCLYVEILKGKKWVHISHISTEMEEPELKKEKKEVAIYIMRNTGKIVEAGAFIKNIDGQLLNEEIQDVLLEVSFKTQSIVPYVVLKMSIENESASLHAFASTLLSDPLCWVCKAKNGLNY